MSEVLDRIRYRVRLLGLFAIACVLPVAISIATLALIPLLCLLLAHHPSVGAVFAVFWAGSLAWSWWRYVFTSAPIPEGRALAIGECPAFEDYFEEIRAGWVGPSVAQIRFPVSWNLGLLTRPIFGLLGWCHFYWDFGLLPLVALSRQELSCLIGWHMVFWSKQHGWLNLELKRLFRYWQGVAELTAPAMEDEGMGVVVYPKRGFHRFAAWIRDRLLSFVIEEHFNTDRDIAREHGARVHARALLRLALLEPMVSRNVIQPWDKPGISCSDPVGEIRAFLGRWPTEAGDILELALDDIYASGPMLLRMRLDRLGVEPHIPLPPSDPTVLDLLEPVVQEELESLNSSWGLDLAQDEKAFQDHRESELTRTEVLKDAIEGGTATPAEVYEWCEARSDGAEPIGLLHHLDRAIGEDASLADLRVLRAKLRIKTGKLVEAEEDLTELEALHPYNRALVQELRAEKAHAEGDSRGADVALDLAARLRNQNGLDGEERRFFRTTDPMEPHGMSHDELAPVLSWLRKDSRVKKAWLVRKRLTVFPDRPFLMLVVRPRSFPLVLGREKFERRLLADLTQSLEFPDRCDGSVMLAPGSLINAHPASKVPGSKIYDR